MSLAETVVIAILLVECVLVVPAAWYVVAVYRRASRIRPREDVPPLYTMVALLCIVGTICGVAQAALLSYYFVVGDFVSRGFLMSVTVIVLLSVPVVVAEFIRRIRRSPGIPPADPPSGIAT